MNLNFSTARLQVMNIWRIENIPNDTPNNPNNGIALSYRWPDNTLTKKLGAMNRIMQPRVTSTETQTRDFVNNFDVSLFLDFNATTFGNKGPIKNEEPNQTIFAIIPAAAYIPASADEKKCFTNI